VLETPAIAVRISPFWYPLQHRCGIFDAYASGFSTCTAQPRSNACSTGSVCWFSLVETMTALTSGREIAARLSPV
jgi:hypothetical protein